MLLHFHFHGPFEPYFEALECWLLFVKSLHNPSVSTHCLGSRKLPLHILHKTVSCWTSFSYSLHCVYECEQLLPMQKCVLHPPSSPPPPPYTPHQVSSCWQFVSSLKRDFPIQNTDSYRQLRVAFTLLSSSTTAKTNILQQPVVRESNNKKKIHDCRIEAFGTRPKHGRTFWNCLGVWYDSDDVTDQTTAQ